MQLVSWLVIICRNYMTINLKNLSVLLRERLYLCKTTCRLTHWNGHIRKKLTQRLKTAAECFHRTLIYWTQFRWACCCCSWRPMRLSVLHHIAPAPFCWCHTNHARIPSSWISHFLKSTKCWQEQGSGRNVFRLYSLIIWHRMRSQLNCLLWQCSRAATTRIRCEPEVVMHIWQE